MIHYLLVFSEHLASGVSHDPPRHCSKHPQLEPGQHAHRATKAGGYEECPSYGYLAAPWLSCEWFGDGIL